MEDEERIIIPNNPVELNEYILDLQEKLSKVRKNGKEYKALLQQIEECFALYNSIVGFKAFEKKFYGKE